MTSFPPRGARLHCLSLAFLGVLLACTAADGSREDTVGDGIAPVVVTYHVSEGDDATGVRESDRELARWAIQSWAAAAGAALEVVESEEADASIVIQWVRADQGLYGEMRRRVVDGRPVADVFVRPDIRGLGSDIEAAATDPLFRDAVVFLTCVHEIGHAFGLPHTADFADIMYTFQFGGDFVAYFQRFRNQLSGRADIPTADPFSDGDRAAIRALLEPG